MLHQSDYSIRVCISHCVPIRSLHRGMLALTRVLSLMPIMSWNHGAPQYVGMELTQHWCKPRLTYWQRIVNSSTNCDSSCPLLLWSVGSRKVIREFFTTEKLKHVLFSAPSHFNVLWPQKTWHKIKWHTGSSKPHLSIRAKLT